MLVVADLVELRDQVSVDVGQFLLVAGVDDFLEMSHVGCSVGVLTLTFGSCVIRIAVVPRMPPNACMLWRFLYLFKCWKPVLRLEGIDLLLLDRHPCLSCPFGMAVHT